MEKCYEEHSSAKVIWLVNAWSVANNMCFGQIQVDETSNERTASPKQLELLDITGVTITINAVGCRTKTADEIVDLGGDFVLALKGSQGEFHEDVKLYLDSNINKYGANKADFSGEVHGDLGRIEATKSWLCTDVDWLIERHPKWKTVKRNAATNFSFLNKIALALLTNEKIAKMGIKSKRLTAGWDEKYLAGI